MNKNIWILQTGEPLQIDDGFRPMRCINLSSELVKQGHKVTIWSSAFSHQTKLHRSKSFKVIEINQNLTINLIPSYGYKKNIGIARLFDHISLAWNLRKALKENNFPVPDIAFIGYPPIETAFVLGHWLEERDVPYIVDLKDQWPHLFLEIFPALLKPFFSVILFPYFLLGKKSLNMATGFTSMSEGYVSWMKKFSGDSDKPFFIAPLTTRPLIQDQDITYNDQQTDWLSIHQIDSKLVNRFCFVGTFMSVFDFIPLRDAIRELNSLGYQYEVVLCGEGGYLPEVKDMMSEFDNVIFTGWINEQQVKLIYKLSKASIIPYKNIDNYKINIPNKVVDAFANSRPIIATLEGQIDELCKEYNVGFSCFPGSNMSLSMAMIELLKNDALCSKMNENAIHLYEKKFSFEQVYSGLSEFIIRKSN